ncbi:RNA-directed DNA polymerase, eukaryota, reverse transcriptase zinc-binding domain protein [Tanacetum coccineum]
MARRSKRTIRIPLKLSNFMLTMTNNKNKQKEDVMDYENDDNAMKIGDNNVVVDDEANGRSRDEGSGSSGEFCAAENEFLFLNELNKQQEDGNSKENDEIGEGSGRRNTENERCEDAKATINQGVSNYVPKSFADVTRTNQGNADNTLSLIPICIEEGREVVVFDEELVIEGSRKWEFTLCGHFVGCRMSSSELRYNLVRMWSKFGLKDIVSQNEAWTVKGISTIASGVGKPLIMDKTTTKLCKYRTGNFGYARVLVEINANKEPKEKIGVCYKSKDNKTICFKFVEVEYSWKPPMCSKCKVFGHNNSTCGKRDGGPNENGNKANQGSRTNATRQEFRPITRKIVDEGPSQTPIRTNNTATKEANASTYRNSQRCSETDDPVVQKQNGIDIVNKYVMNQRQLTIEESKDWSSEMFEYFKEQWETKWMTEYLDEEDVFDEVNGIAKNMTDNEVNDLNSEFRMATWNVRGLSNKDMQKQVKKFISDEKLSYTNMDKCDKGCRIMVGWKEEDVNLMVIHSCKQAVLCLVEIKKSKNSFYCCFVYAANLGKERRLLWKELQRGSFQTEDMVEFQECLEQIEVEDLNYSGVHFTWVQSRQDPSNGILKKIDRVLGKDIQRRIDKEPHTSSQKQIEVDVLKEYNTARQDEEKMLFQRAKIKWLSDGDKNSKFFHIFLKGRAHKSRIEKVQNEKRERFKGANSNPKTICDEDAKEMIRRISDVEIKEAFFDICDNKAPGPDGYTVKFYKKAWTIVGPDVCAAVKDFFKRGKLIGEVNATLITLVPKITTPIKVSDYRPIACCNSAFIPGRQITDNILLTQELLKGYSWKSGARRVAMKIDIQKAYDTVNWDFLEDALNMQGYPISPYIFTLVMEVFTLILNKQISDDGNFKFHWGCKDLQISHLCFADDLLVLCRGDIKSVKVVKSAMDIFSSISGLNPNIGKSIIFFSNVEEQVRNEILAILPFKIGSLPVTYLGVPLITKSPTFTDCKCLIDKVKEKVSNWKNKLLSYVGRLQLIASILSSMQVYWASVFILPKSVIKEIDKLLKGFLWCQGELSKGKAKVAWKQICRPMDEVGLGIKSLEVCNEVLMTKHLWNVATLKESLWVKWININRIRGESIWAIDCDKNASYGWKQII